MSTPQPPPARSPPLRQRALSPATSSSCHRRTQTGVNGLRASFFSVTSPLRSYCRLSLVQLPVCLATCSLVGLWTGSCPHSLVESSVWSLVRLWTGSSPFGYMIVLLISCHVPVSCFLNFFDSPYPHPLGTESISVHRYGMLCKRFEPKLLLVDFFASVTLMVFYS